MASWLKKCVAFSKSPPLWGGLGGGFEAKKGALRSPLQPLPLPITKAQDISLFCKRDDLYTPAAGTALQGNKVRKLEGFLRDALTLATPPLLVSFGGAYSNHVSALATAGSLYGLPVHLFIRGEEVDNALLRQARKDGAELSLISRPEYRQKTDEDWLEAKRSELARQYERPEESIWFIPEGGTTAKSAQGVGQLYQEVMEELGKPPDFLCISAGTGGSAAGLIQAADTRTRIEVYPALKGNWMEAEIKKLLPAGASENWGCITDYHFGGYGKFPQAWMIPSAGMATRADIGVAGLPPLEVVYTAKLFAGVLDRIGRKVYPAESAIVIVHTGGIY